MLESIFVLVIVMGFISFILAVDRESVIFSATSLLMWLVSLAGHLYIVVPGVDGYFTEVAFFAVSIGFIVLNIMWLILLYTDLSFWQKKRF